MEIILAIPFFGLFLYLNYQIIKTDLSEKIIPNKYLKYLLYLLPFAYIYFWHSGYLSQLSLGGFALEIMLTFIVGFGLFHFNIWGAGDSKYLLVLSLYAGPTGVHYFIFHIGIVTGTGLFIYFLKFWLSSFFSKQYSQNLIKNVSIDLDKKLQSLLKGKNAYTNLFRSIVYFYIGFISLKLYKISVLEYLGVGNGFSRIFFLISFFILISILLSISKFTLKYFFPIFRYKIQKHKHWFMNIFIVTFICFLFFKWNINPDELRKDIYLILTFGTGIYIICRIIKYMLATSFVYQEQIYIHINNLKAGSTLDKAYLLKIFSPYNRKNPISVSFYKDTQKFITKMSKNITEDDVLTLQKKYKQMNILCQEDTEMSRNFNRITHVSIYKTFAFSPYIFAALCLSLLFGDLILKQISDLIIVILRKIYNF